MLKSKKFFDSDLKFYIENKADFEVIQSTGSKSIDSKVFEKKIYTDSKITPKIFSISKKLKSDLSACIPIFNDITKGKIPEYYFSNENLGDFCSKEVYNIDIKSAYLYALRNNGFLSDKIFSEIFDLKKKDRLITLGLLAYQPIVFYYEKGILNYEKITVRKNDFRNCFFYCVHEISELMKKLINLAQNNYFFCWVDGIYFEKNDFIKDLLENELKENGYLFSFDVLKNFTHTKNENFHSFEYEKNEEKIKINVPTYSKKRKLEKDKLFAKFIQNPNYENSKKYFEFE